MSEEEKGFEVRDKRKIFADTDEAASEPTAPQADAPVGEADEDMDEGFDDGMDQSVDFIAFVSSLAASSLMHLGERLAADQPDMTNLPAAKQMIDIIAMLDEKTKGNLSQDEAAVMENILYTLRMKFVSVSSGK